MLHPISPHKLVSARWLDVFDIRGRAEREMLGFIPGSIQFDEAQLQIALSTHRLPTNAVLVCNSGARAREIVAMMSKNVVAQYLEGGVFAWQEAGLPAAGVALPLEVQLFSVDTVEELVREMRSYFTAEVAEAMLDAGMADVDPSRLFDAALESAGCVEARIVLDEVDVLIDHVAAISRRVGTPLRRIADDINRIAWAKAALVVRAR